MAVATLDACFESASLEYLRVQAADAVGVGASHARQLNTSYTPTTNLPEIRRWTVAAGLADLTEYLAVEAVWAASKGGTLAIEWTPPDESTAIDVLIADYRPVQGRPGLFEVRMTLEEDF